MKSVLTIALMAATATASAQPYGIRNLRYDEDHSYLKDTVNKTWYQKLKFTRLNKSGSLYLSTGGETRYQIQYFKNEDWGDVPIREYTAFYTRNMLHTNLHWGSRFRAFGQLISTHAAGRVTGNRPVDENRLDVHQLFADLNILNTESKKLVLRTGRQELLYGSQRLIAVREGPNNRLTFDAVKVFFQKENLRVDAYYGHPLLTRFSIFDDGVNRDEDVWSGYAVINDVPFVRNVDLYYIGYWSREKQYSNGPAEETRHSIGTRIWQNDKPFKYDIEAVYQFGDFGAEQIDAYTASANLRYHFERWKLSPTLGFKTEVISGDKKNGDGKLHTFNPLFPRGAYFGLAALIGPVNLIDVHPSLDLQFTKDLSFTLEYDAFWRYSRNDGIYGPNVMMTYPPASNERYIGYQFGANLEYAPTEHLSVVPEFTFFRPGFYLKDVTPGRNVLFSALTFQFKF